MVWRIKEKKGFVLQVLREGAFLRATARIGSEREKERRRKWGGICYSSGLSHCGISNSLAWRKASTQASVWSCRRL